jgi:hypothetical protein
MDTTSEVGPKIKIDKTIILAVVLHGSKMWSLTLKEEQD